MHPMPCAGESTWVRGGHGVAVVCAVLLVVLVCRCGDDEYVKRHVTIWDGAFIIDSLTLGVICWEYDQEMPTDAWGDWKFANINQYLYKYHFQDSSLEYVATLARDAGFYATYPSVFYSAPWVVYKTNDGQPAGGMYNLQTGERRIAVRRDASIDAVSPQARYVAYHYGIDMTHEIADLWTGTIVDTVPEGIRVFYVGDSLDALAWRSCGFSGCPVYVGAYEVLGRGFDTSGTTEYAVWRVTSDKRCFVLLINQYTVGAGVVASLLRDTLTIDTLDGLVRGCDDLLRQTGLYMELRGRTIYAGNYMTGVYPFALLNEHQQERE